MIFQTTIDIRTELNNSALYPTDLAEPGAESGAVLGGIISTIVSTAIVFAALAVLIYFIWAGFNWLTAGGDKGKVEDARNRLTNAIIGMAIVASAYSLYTIVDRFFGVGNVETYRQEQVGKIRNILRNFW